MTQTTESLRAAITRSKAGQKRWICPPDLKKEIVRHVRAGREAGAQVKTLAGELGVSQSGLERWLRDAAQGFRPVRLVEEPAPGTESIVLLTPGGYRLEGLSPRSAAELLRHLGC